jgi:hypothetical protein
VGCGGETNSKAGMRSRALALFASASLSACVCGNTAESLLFACVDSAECAEGHVCRAGACRPEDLSEDVCFPGEDPDPCLPDRYCDSSAGLCRAIDGCKIPVECGDGGLCLGPARPDGTDCDDAEACSFGDHCEAGACVGTAYACPLADQCRLAAMCLGDGGCGQADVPDGTACDDGESCSTADACSAGRCVGTNPTTYPDGDGDGLGDSAASRAQCPVPAGSVFVGGDCDDASANVYRLVAALRDDPDQDGYSNGGATDFCVGDTLASDAGRTYYRAADGGYPYTDADLGADCAPLDSSRYRAASSLVQDNDQDGYPPNNNQSAQCVASSTTIAGRTYYANGTGGFWMPVSSCINKNGGSTQCQAPFDPDDANPAVP